MPGRSWALGMNADPHRKRIYGIAKIHEDGSSFFTAPAGENIFFQPGDTGIRMVHYAVDVQPTLDKHCVSCHSGAKPKARLDLTGVPTPKHSRSYENLIGRRLVSYADCRYGSSNFNAVPPLVAAPQNARR